MAYYIDISSSRESIVQSPKVRNQVKFLTWFIWDYRVYFHVSVMTKFRAFQAPE